MDKSKAINNYLSILFDGKYKIKCYHKKLVSIENKQNDLKLLFYDNKCKFNDYNYNYHIEFETSFKNLSKLLKQFNNFSFKTKILNGRFKKDEHLKECRSIKYLIYSFNKYDFIGLENQYIENVDSYFIDININVLKYKYKNDIYYLFLKQGKKNIYMIWSIKKNNNDIKIIYKINISKFLYLKAIQDLIELLDFKAA